jgi:serine/threonine protein phosphatase PrpC
VTSFRLVYAARSDVGLVRSGNEDSGYAGPRLLLVADGMGGHAGGEVASSLVAQALMGLDDARPEDIAEALVQAIHRANDELRSRIEAQPRLEGMGTTLTAILSDGERLGVGHVGDSRAYVFRDGELRQLTHDQTYVQSLVDEGRITADQAVFHPQRSLLLQALDGRGSVDPEIHVLDPLAGDRFLLCSDGLSGFVEETDVAAALSRGKPADAVDELVNLALDAGAPDNVTCVVADVVAADAGPGDEVAKTARNETPKAAASGVLVGAIAPDSSVTDSGSSDQPGDPDGDQEITSGGSGKSRTLFGLLLVVAVLLAASTTAIRWWQTQYFVGVDGKHVAIYQGLSSPVLGMRLARVIEPTGLDVANLSEFARERVHSGIEASSRANAHQVVQRLQAQSTTAAASG